MRYVDQQIARLTEYLLRTRPGALLLFAADHGEEFGEHGGATGRFDYLKEEAFRYAFVMDRLGIKEKKLKN